MTLLKLTNVTKLFGNVAAITKLDMEINQGEIHGLIGPNGAGKSTLFNLITGFFPSTSGNIVFKGEDITRIAAHKIVQKGIARSFQQTFLFMDSTVMENIMIGFHLASRTGALNEFLHTSKALKRDQQCRQQAMEVLELMRLQDQYNVLAGNLPHGHQRALGVCIALASHPSLLLLDEPVTGMTPTESQLMIERIRTIHDMGITIVLVEHSMRVVMNVCDRITVINYGIRIAEGLPLEIRQNKEVEEAYLGKVED